MIDRNLRGRLDRDLQKMLQGELSRADFDEACWFRYALTPDRGVREVAEFFRSIYADSGSARVDEPAQVRSRLVRAVLFLRSEQEYRWPAETEWGGTRLWIGLTVMMFLPVVMGIIFFALPTSWSLSQAFGWSFTGLGTAGLAFAVWLVGRPHRQDLEKKSSMVGYPHRDRETWPFREMKDLCQASSRCHIASQLAEGPAIEPRQAG